MRSKHATKLFMSLFILSLSAIGNAQGSFVAGPIERISLNPRSITVLGQTVAIDGSTIFSVDGQSLRLSQALGLLAVGDFTYVQSGVASDGAARSSSTYISCITGEPPIRPW